MCRCQPDYPIPTSLSIQGGAVTTRVFGGAGEPVNETCPLPPNTGALVCEAWKDGQQEESGWIFWETVLQAPSTRPAQ